MTSRESRSKCERVAALHYLTFTAASFAQGGHSRHKELVSGLLGQGHHVTWIGFVEEETLTLRGVRFLPLSGQLVERLPLLGRFVSYLISLHRHRRALREVDGVVLLGEIELLAALTMPVLRSKSLIMVNRNDLVEKARVRARRSPSRRRRMVNRIRGPFFAWLQRRLYPFVSTIFVQRQGIARKLARRTALPMSRFEVLPNNCLPSWSAASVGHERPEWRSSKNQPIVGFVGNLLWEVKGLELLLAAFMEIRQAINARLVVVGDGPDRRWLERRVRHLKLGAEVRLLGRVQNATALMPFFDVLLVPSAYDDCPNVVLEALAARIPVVATNIAAHRFLLGSRASLIPDGNPHAMARHATTILRDPKHRREVLAIQEERRRKFDFDWGEEIARRIAGLSIAS